MTSVTNIVLDMHTFYQKILNLYESNLSNVDKWTTIAKYMHDNNSVIVKTFLMIKNQEIRTQIELDYETDFKQLDKQILQESDPIVKCSFIILSMHHIIYGLLSTEGNYYFNLNGPEEMHILKKNIIYYINMSIKNEQNIYFHAFILQYALESLFNGHFYIGIDFEFTNRTIQLSQLNFEHNIALQSIIMMISPNELESVMTDNFINLIICNSFIKKILHGSDSLDIPYMYKVLLQNDSKKIVQFTKTLIDTRFLCEYYKLTRDEVSDNKCSIYDEDPTRSAVYYFSVVSEQQQNKLTELLQSMPPSYDVTWNIHKMPKSQVYYAQYDVIFLKYFYYRMIYVATNDEESDIGKKIIITLYKHVLTEITQLVYLENNNITFLRLKCKEEVDVANNYFIRKNNNIIKMIDIFNQISVNLSTDDPKVDIDKLVRVNHFKTTIMTMIKRIVYGYISQKCIIHKDKSTLWTDKLNNNFIFDYLSEYEFRYLFKMFKDLEKTIETRIKIICS